MACANVIGKDLPVGSIVGTTDNQTLTNKTINLPNNTVTGTAWRVFHTDGTGALIELALGAAGTYLQANGVSAAPTWGVPAGQGDVSKVGTPVDNQIGVWTGNGTIEGSIYLTMNRGGATTYVDITADGIPGTLAGVALNGEVFITRDSDTTTIQLQNIDSIDATTEATIEAAIDTLANLTSIQGHTVTLTGAFIRSGAHSLTLTTTGATNVTLPTTGTLANLTSAQTFTNKTIDASLNTISNLDINDFAATTIVTSGETIASNNNDTTLPTSAAVKAYADSILAANDAMVYMGAIDASTNPNYPAADAGDAYKISVAGKIGGASGPNVEVGDMIICTVDSTGAGTHATVGANWTIIQSNLDGAVIGPASSTNTNIVTFDGTTGKLVADGGATIAQVRARSTHTGTQLLSTISDAGTIASQDANSVSITGGSISGITDLSIGDGGTGASTATQARQNLGVEIGVDVQAYNANLTTWAGKTAPAGVVVGTTDTQTLTNKTLTSPVLTLTGSAAPTPTVEGRIEWDTDNDRIVIGNGASQTTFYSKTENDTLYQAIVDTVEQTSDTTIAANTRYIANKAATRCVLTLPATYAVGDQFIVVGKGATGWRIDQSTAGQVIRLGGVSSTSGIAGYADSTAQYDTMILTCVTANADLVAEFAVGCIDLL